MLSGHSTFPPKKVFFFFFGLRSCSSWILQFPLLANNFFFPHEYIQRLLVPQHNNNNLMSREYRERPGLMTPKLNHHIYSVPPSFCVSVTWCHNSLKLHQGIVFFCLFVFFRIITVWTWGRLWGHEDSSVLSVSCLMDELNWKQRSWVMFILHVTKSQHTQGLQGWYCCFDCKSTHIHLYRVIIFKSLYLFLFVNLSWHKGVHAHYFEQRIIYDLYDLEFAATSIY